jgi:uncharacterized protein (TIGR02391 family)
MEKNNSETAKHILNIASSLQTQVNLLNLGISQNIDIKSRVIIYDKIITDHQLKDVTRELFSQKHYALAVEEAYKLINNLVKSRSQYYAIDGADLMRTVFSASNPILKLNRMLTTSQKDQQRGYMDIFAGCMTGIRNPRAHEHRYLDQPDRALEMLSLANHLITLVRSSRKTKVKKKI